MDDVSMIVTPRFEQTGSIGADTAASRLLDVETRLEIASSHGREEIARLVATAERMCFMMDAIREPHEIRAVTTLNGEALEA